MKMGDGDREGTGRKVPQKSYRQRPARVRARVKWWGKSPPRRRRQRRHGKPRAVQDRTGAGLPARHKPRVIVALRASGASRSGGMREMAVQSRKGRTESGLQGSGTPFHRDSGKLPIPALIESQDECFAGFRALASARVLRLRISNRPDMISKTMAPGSGID